MPTLNQKLLLRVLLVVVVLGAGLAVLHHVQAGHAPDALLWQANAAAEKGKTDKAIFYMRQYLEFRPDDHDTAIRLADLMLERAYSPKDLTNVHFIYERVLREEPQRSDVGRKLVTLCLRMGRHADALTHAERLLKEAPNDGALLAQVAECQLAQNRPLEAKLSFERAIAVAPDNIRSYELLSRLLVRQLNRPKDAGPILDRMVQSNSSDPTAFLVRAEYLKGQNRLDECLRDLDRVFVLDPENGEALVMSAEVLQARGEVRRAKQALRDAITLYPRYAAGYRALSWLELLSGNQADARTTLERGIAILPDAPELLTPLADLWLDQGEFDRVEDAIRTLESRKDSAVRVSYLRGRVLMKQGKWNEALAVLDTLRTEATGLPGLAAQLNLLIAGCQERRADREHQIEALKRALAADPNHLGARVALANAHLSAGRFEDALKEYQTAAKSPFAGLGVQVTSVRLRLAWARMTDAPAKEWKEIGDSLARFREQYRLAIEPVVLTAEWLAARGEFSQAIKLLRDEVAARPGDPRLWIVLAEFAGRGQGTLAGADAVAAGQLAAGESIELRLARARLFADDVQPGRERRIARLEELSTMASDVDRARLLCALAEIYAGLHDEAGLKRMLTETAARNTNDQSSRRQLFVLALETADVAAQARWRDEVRRVEGPDGKSTALLEAIHAARSASAGDRRHTEWQDLARSVLAATPDHADAHLLMALNAEKRGDAPGAAAHYETAADLDVTSIANQEARLGFYLRNGQEETAQRVLARLQADPRVTPSKFRVIVEGAISQGGPDALSNCLSWLAGQIKREPRSAIWAGRILENRGKVTDALAVYRQIAETQPAFADGWSARLLASARLGDAEVAATMAGAAKALDRKAFFGVCAECGSAVRAKVPSWSPPVTTADDRRAYAEACISACEARGRLEDAMPVLMSIAEDKDARPEDAAWARRTIAVLTAALGTPDQKRDAIGTLRDAVERPMSVAESRSRLAALGVALRSVSGDDRRLVVREMIGLTSGIVRDPTATSNDWFQLAQLHRMAGDRPAARKCLQELSKREPNNLFYLAVNVDDLLSEGKLEEARPLAMRLVDGTADVRVAAALARFHTLANDTSAALEVIDKFVRAADAGTTDGMARQRQAAELLDQLTRMSSSKGLSGSKRLLDGATERYRASLRGFPEAVTQMAALLAFHGEVQQAFEELERQKVRLSPAALATAGVAVLRSGHASPRQFQTVKTWIDEALVAMPEAMALKLNLGELHALRQDFATAEQVYRDVLKTDPKNLVALNNLAWILAPRPESADQALKYADRAIELYGATGEMLDTRARILISAGKYERAVADLNDAIGQGGTPLRFFHLALAQLRMQRPDDAVRTFREARARGLDPKSIHPNDLPTYKALSTRADAVQ